MSKTPFIHDSDYRITIRPAVVYHPLQFPASSEVIHTMQLAIQKPAL